MEMKSSNGVRIVYIAICLSLRAIIFRESH